MTKKEFINLYFAKEEFENKADAERKATAFLNVIEEGLLKGEKITFQGFGKFEVIERVARTCKNPKTGEDIQVEARKSVKFKAGKSLSEKIK